ncbi:MAG TPA: RNA 2',3'-cyclic phosphodiesterase [Verrucomicrobiae bacterium]|nr:RNA 2',3'-cyclic phosphodiesterase [Verrucomicrobiae bacterium]
MTGEGSTERFRLFVAIPVPDVIREEMIRVQQALEPLAPHPVVRWTKPEQFHLTLRFLGDVSSDRITALQESLRAVCSGTRGLHLHARGIGFFPGARFPRVVWVGIDNHEKRLGELQERIERAVRPFTMEPGGEHFAGHVTLGRFKRSNILKINDLRIKMEAMKDCLFGKWTAWTIEIIRSELSPAGTRHTVLAALPLGRGIELP